MIKCLPQEIKHVVGLAPQADGALTSDCVCLKNFSKAWIKVVMAQAAANIHTTVPMQATNVALAGGKVLTNTVPIWSNLDVSLSDLLTERAAALNYALDAGVANKVVWFEIDPASLDTANNFDCIYVTSAGSNVANILSVDFYLQPKTKAAVLDPAITN